MFWGLFNSSSQNEEIEGLPNGPNLVTELAHPPVTHLEQYLSYYVGRLKPGYAVLVTGNWGTGKSYQVRHALPDGRAHYVSLFGLNTPAEIEAQIFSKMYPEKANFKKRAEQADNAKIEIPIIGALGISGIGSILTDVFIKNTVDNSKPLVLDDLERSTVKIEELLGIINRYVEHHGCRVVVIAHDSKVIGSFSEAKEKIFGQTIVVEPNVDASFTEFNKLFSMIDEDRLGDLKNEVLSIFRESGASSLRVLRHVVEDVRRLTASLEDKHLSHRTAMVELIRLFSAFSIEVRSNVLRRADLCERRKTAYSFRLNLSSENEAPSTAHPFLVADAKYSSIDLTSELLSDKVLIETLIEGRFVPANIRASLNASAYFVEERISPPWQLVISFDKLDDQVVNDALQAMEKQFLDRTVTESGEFLHIVALKMLLASKGLSEETVIEVLQAAKLYIDETLNDGRLEPRPPGSMWTNSFATSYGGISYWVADDYSREFDEIFNYLVRARSEALKLRFPEFIPPLLDTVRTDGQRFFEKICHTRNGTIEFEDIPILASIPPTEFVEAWLASPKQGWYWIGAALKERNQAAASYLSLRTEADWFPKVVSEMERRAQAETGLAQLRIRRAAQQVGVPATTPTPAMPTSPVGSP